MRRYLVILFAVLVSGCARMNPSNVMQSWQGQNYADLMLKWGPPTRSTPDGRGGQILVYEYDRRTGQIAGRAVPQLDGSVIYTAPVSTGYVATRMFWVNPSGVIYNWRWQGF